jgi:hypothetical protein
MTRVATFGRSAVFAALAAAGWLPWLVVVGPLTGARAALGLYLVGLTTAYLAGVAPRRASALRAALAAALAGALLVAVARATGELALGLGVVLGLGRSVVLYRERPARALVTEAALVGGGLLFARALATPSAGGVMLAVWGFFLVQSLFFLVGGVAPRADEAARRDPFEEAYARAMALVEEGDA